MLARKSLFARGFLAGGQRAFVGNRQCQQLADLSERCLADAGV